MGTDFSLFSGSGHSDGTAFSRREIIDTVVSIPRMIPRDIREEIAALIVTEIMDGESVQIKDSSKFVKRYGVFYPIIIHLRHSETWQLIKELSSESSEAAGPVLHSFLTKIFDMIDQFPKVRDGIYGNLDDEMRELLLQFEKILDDTRNCWDRETSGIASPLEKEISRLISEYSELLAQIDSDKIHNEEINPDFVNDCSEATESLEQFVNDRPEFKSEINLDELKNIIVEIKQAIESLKTDNAESTGNSSEPEKKISPSKDLPEHQKPGPENGSKTESDSGMISESGPEDTAGQENGDEHRQGSGNPDESGSSDENKADGGSDQSESSDTGNPSNGGKQSSSNSLEKISKLIQSVLKQLQKNSGTSQSSSTFEKNELVKKVNDFSKMKGSNKLLQQILQNAALDSVNSMIQSIKPHIETINFLAQLFPARQWGSEVSDLKKQYIQNLEKYAKFIEKNDELKAILKLIGRIELEYGIRKLSISPMGRSEMHSITRSSDIARLLPTEAAKFHHPLLKKKLYADFTEGKLLTYQLRGKHWTAGPPKKKEQGPVIALVDTSSSMNGSPEIVAKSVVLALTKRMLKEERDVKVILFSGPGSTVEIELTSKKKMAPEFLKFLGSSFGGGTDFNTALKTGLESLKQPAFRGADLLFITDGVSEISKSIIDEWEKVKKEQDARVFSLIIGSENAGGLKPISDYTYFVQKDRDWTLQNSPASMIRFIASLNNPKDSKKRPQLIDTPPISLPKSNSSVTDRGIEW